MCGPLFYCLEPCVAANAKHPFTSAEIFAFFAALRFSESPSQRIFVKKPSRRDGGYSSCRPFSHLTVFYRVR